MDSDYAFDHCLLLRVGVVAEGNRCLSVMRMLDAIKPNRLRLKLIGLAATNKPIVCNQFAEEMGVRICEDYRELPAMESLDLILELTGQISILADLVRLKPASVGILDQQAAMLFFDIAHQYEWVAQRASEISLASSFASALLEASPDGVMVMDRDLRIIQCNASPIVTGGRGKESVLGKHCFEVIHGSLVPCAGHERACPIKETLRTHKPARAAHEVVTEAGETRVRQVTVYPLFNSLGDIVQFVEVIRDITQDLSVRVEQRAKAIKDDLAKAVQEDRLASLGRLVASVCHEINNPISSIVTFNKLVLCHLRDHTRPAEGDAALERYLSLSIKEALRCGDIVKNLLTFARQKSIEPVRIDMIEMVNTIMLLTAHQLEMANVTHALDLPGPPYTAWGDNALIQQCLMNLVFNALESMPSGGHMTISGGRLSEDAIWLSVGDTGRGIDPEDLSRIFEPFYSTKGNGKGVGLGLSMVYGIIRKHGGGIEVKSAPGQGAVFKIMLPAKPLKTGQEKIDHGISDADIDRR